MQHREHTAGFASGGTGREPLVSRVSESAVEVFSLLVGLLMLAGNQEHIDCSRRAVFLPHQLWLVVYFGAAEYD